MKNFLIASILFLILAVLGVRLFANESTASPNKVFTKEEIKQLADAYVENNLGIKNPAIVDVDKDGDFDILVFKDGNVEYYKNTGTLEEPFFIPENKEYDKYTIASLIDLALPYPVFFADGNGNGSPDMFVIKDKMYNSQQQRYEHRVLYAENFLGLDTGVLITIVLVLLIIVLVLIIL